MGTIGLERSCNSSDELIYDKILMWRTSQLSSLVTRCTLWPYNQTFWQIMPTLQSKLKSLFGKHEVGFEQKGDYMSNWTFLILTNF
jgi:hypothetical protein